MDFPKHIDTYSMGHSILCFKGPKVEILDNNYVVMALQIGLILGNSADPNEMPHYAAFHLCLHCLPKYLSTGTQNEKG